MIKPWFMEGEIVEVEETGGTKYYIIHQTEDLVYDYRGYGTVATVTQGSYTQVSDIEPKQVKEPETRMYQLRAGIDVGMATVEMLAGKSRRGTYKVPKPLSGNRFVGYFTNETSPFENPTYEFYLFSNEVPAVSVYNPLGFTITPYISVRGLKHRMFDLGNPKTASKLKLVNVEAMLDRLRKGIQPHRHITKLGITEA